MTNENTKIQNGNITIDGVTYVLWDMTPEAIEAVQEILPTGWTAVPIGDGNQVIAVSDNGYHRYEVYSGDTVCVRGSGVFVVEE